MTFRMTFHWNRTFLAASGLLVTLHGCGSGKSLLDTQVKSFVSTETKWSNPKGIPVCWVNPGDTTQEVLGVLKDIVTSEYETKTAIRFSRWNICQPGDQDATIIRVRLDVANTTFNAGTGAWTHPGGQSHVGAKPEPLDGEAVATLRVGAPSTWVNSAGLRNATMSATLHEFGHAIGLNHEHQRSDRTDICAGGVGSDSDRIVINEGGSDTYVGNYDPNSIMNYCRADKRPYLTQTDVMGVDYLYPDAARGNRIVPSNDFNRDGHTDILWYNASTGESQIWQMRNEQRVGRATVMGTSGAAALIGLPFRLVGSRDFNRDGMSDLLWYNEQSGETQIWYMNDSTLAGRATITYNDGRAALIGLPWSIVGFNDFDRDGNSDILWHNAQTGESQVWFMNGSSLRDRATILNEVGSAFLVGLPWHIVGTGDFNQDKSADILWHNDTTGETQIWCLNGTRVISRATVIAPDGRPVLIGPPFSIVASDDFDLNGNTDILWHNSSTGEAQIWFMNGAVIARRATVGADYDSGGAMVGAPWRIVNH